MQKIEKYSRPSANVKKVTCCTETPCGHTTDKSSITEHSSRSLPLLYDQMHVLLRSSRIQPKHRHHQHPSLSQLNVHNNRLRCVSRISWILHCSGNCFDTGRCDGKMEGRAEAACLAVRLRLRPSPRQAAYSGAHVHVHRNGFC